MKRRKRRSGEEGSEELTPLVAMIYQIRAEMAGLVLPIFAGIKTVWLLLFMPKRFFDALFNKTQPLESFVTPVAVFWRAFSAEARAPLQPVPFLLLGIAFATLAEVGDSNVARLTLAVSDLDLVNVFSQAIARNGSNATQTVATVDAFFDNAWLIQLRAFFAADLVSIIFELGTYLITTVVFTYLFYIFSKRRISATHSYTFWLYMLGLQFFTTTLSLLIVLLFGTPISNALDSTSGSVVQLAELIPAGLPIISVAIANVRVQLPDLIRTGFFWFLQSGWEIILQYALPVWVLPRLFAVTGRQVFSAVVFANIIMFGLRWLILFGLGAAIVALS